MSIAQLQPTTVFDQDDAVAYLDGHSSGLVMTREEFLAVEDADETFRYELIHGVVVVTPPPDEGERGPNDELGFLLRLYAREEGKSGRLEETLPEHDIPTPVGVRRADRVIWTKRRKKLNTKKDPPDIAVEFVSASKRDRRRDYDDKRNEYAAIGVKEYWIIDRFRRTMTVCRGATIARVVKESEVYETPLLPGFKLELGRLLAIADRYQD